MDPSFQSKFYANQTLPSTVQNSDQNLFQNKQTEQQHPQPQQQQLLQIGNIDQLNVEQCKNILQNYQSNDSNLPGLHKEKKQPDLKRQIAQMLAQKVINNIISDKLQQSRMQESLVLAADDEKSCFSRCCGFLTIEFYQPYFDVTTEIVKQRLLLSLNPFTTKFFESNIDKPDLYGPFWLSSTLIFALTAGGNISSAILNSDADFTYNFDYIPQACSVIYSFSFLFPIIICILMKLFGSKRVDYLNIICIYGYANAIFIPVAVLCSIPFQAIQWGCMAYAMVSSSLFLINCLQQELKRYEIDRKKIFIAIILVLQLILLLYYKLYFFDTVYKVSGTNTSSQLQISYQNMQKNDFFNSTLDNTFQMQNNNYSKNGINNNQFFNRTFIHKKLQHHNHKNFNTLF